VSKLGRIPKCIICISLIWSSAYGQVNSNEKKSAIANTYIDILHNEYVDIDSADYLFSSASDIYLELKDTFMHAYCLHGLTNVSAARGDKINSYLMLDSLSSFQKFVKPEKGDKYFSMMLSIKEYYDRLGFYEKSRIILSNLVDRIDSVKNVQLKVNVITTVAENYIIQRDYKRAKEILTSSLKQNIPNFSKSTICLLLSEIELFKKNMRLSLDYIQEGINYISGESSNTFYKKRRLFLLLKKINILIELREFENCKNTFDVLERCNFENSSKYHTGYLLAKGKYLNELGEYEIASALADSVLRYALKTSKENTNQFNEEIIKSKILLSDINRVQGYYDRSLNFLLDALCVYNISSFDEIDIDAHYINTVNTILNKVLQIYLNIFNRNGNVSSVDILHVYNILLSINKNSNLKYDSYSFDENVASKNLDLHNEVIEFCILNKFISSAFSYMEESKSNLLYEDLLNNIHRNKSKVNSTLIYNEASSELKIRMIRGKLNQNLSDEYAYDLSMALAQEEYKLNVIKDKIAKSSTHFHKLKYDNSLIKINSISSNLDDKTLYVEYYVSNECLYAAVIGKNSFEIKNCGSLSFLFEELTNSVPHFENSSYEDPILKEISNSIYVYLLKWLDSYSHELSNIIIVPDDILNNLPFELLVDNDGNYLIDKYNIQYQYSGKLWKMLMEKEPKACEYDLVGFAYSSENPNYISERACSNLTDASLLCSDREIDGIKNIFKDKNVSTTFTGQDDLFEKANNTRILHLATHSCLDSQDYSQSKIYLNESHLTYADLQLKDINAELAVLSSCESGYGKIIKGEGAMSIAKAFFHAGCKSALVSLWPVDDCSTSDIMKYFYEGLKDGQAKDVALRNAKLKYRKTAHPSRQHPYYWAGFVLFGDASPMWSKKNNKYFWLGALGFSMMLLGGAYLYKRNVRSAA